MGTSIKDKLQNLSISQMNKSPKNNQMKQAMIVAGASLTMIEHFEETKEIFLAIGDLVDVVLACRVSPQQKADIVNKEEYTRMFGSSKPAELKELYSNMEVVA